MIKNSNSDPNKIAEDFFSGGKFDPNALPGLQGDNNRRGQPYDREDHDCCAPIANAKNIKKLTAEDAQFVGMAKAMQQQMCAAVAKNSSLAEHIDVCMLNTDPACMTGENLRGFVKALACMKAEMVCEAGDEESETKSFLASLLKKCKGWLTGSKCCHHKKPEIARPAVDSNVTNAIANVAMAELGELTPMLINSNIANIDGRLLDTSNPGSKKPQQMQTALA